MGIYNNVTQMWFGTIEKMGWIDAPQSGADTSPVGMSASETLLNGGGFVRNSWDSHKQYQFSWSDVASQSLASKIIGYSNGTYGRGLIYFQNPMHYSTNVLPKRLADPSMALNFEAPSLAASIDPRSTPTPANTNDLPVQTAVYDLPLNFKADRADFTYIPIPPGFSLIVGAYYTSTGNATAGIVADTGAGTARTLIAKLGLNSTTIVSNQFTGVAGIYLGLDVVTPGAVATVSPTAIIARLYDPSDPSTSLDLLNGPWMSGEGNSGVKFNGKPTHIMYGGLDGGQVGLSANFTEVGAWA